MTDDKKAKDEKKDVKVTDDGAADGAPVEGAEGAAEGAGKKSKKKIILFVAVPLLLIVVGGAAAYFTGALDKLLHKKPDCAKVQEGEPGFEECAKEKEAAGETGAPGTFVAIPDIIVNLNSGGKQARFLKISIKLELENAVEQAKIEPLMPRVVDQFQVYLRDLRVEDLKGTAGIYRMKIELLSRVKAAAPGVKVKDVLFQEILVQ